jgi:DNA invertase Pin-like site-specific DNA recombinase
LNPLRVARLVRVSTSHLAQADSPRHQLAFLGAEIAREGWSDTGLVYEAELTGAVILDRPDIRRLIRDAEAGLFDVILLKSISRLGRDTLGLLTVKRMLDDLRVELIALADGYRSFRDPELIFLVHAERAQAGRQEIAKNVRAGIAEAARRGIWPAGTLPFGLRKESRFAIGPDPETAPVVQGIFALRARGMGPAQIARHLNEEAPVKGPAWWHLKARVARLEATDGAAQDDRVQARIRGLREQLLTGSFRWSARTVRLVLANPAYRGELRYNRTTGERRLHGRLVRRGRAEEEWVTIPCPPLVSREAWEAVQAGAPCQPLATAPAAGTDRAPRRAPPRALVSPFLLSGRLHCARCGAPMRAMPARAGAGRRGGDPKGYYVCRAAAEAGAHGTEYLRATDLEEAVLERLRAELAGLKPLGKPRRATGDGGRRDGSALAEALRDLAEARFFRREELRRGRISSEEYAADMAILERREAGLRRRLDASGADRAATSSRPDAKEAALLRLEGPPDAIRVLVGDLVERVEADATGVVIRAAFGRAEVERLRSDSTARRTTR